MGVMKQASERSYAGSWLRVSVLVRVATLAIATLAITTLAITTLAITTLAITTLAITTLAITTLAITTLAITTLAITTLAITTAAQQGPEWFAEDVLHPAPAATPPTPAAWRHGTQAAAVLGVSLIGARIVTTSAGVPLLRAELPRRRAPVPGRRYDRWRRSRHAGHGSPRAAWLGAAP